MAILAKVIDSPNQPRHLAHSHAHEEDIPGTVNLQAVEGDDTAYGQALFPVPNEDPNDPLQWPNWKKTMILVICSFYSFLGNSALLGPSVYIGIYSELFEISPVKASGLISYANLAYGFGSLLLVPAYLKFGRRPIMLLSILFFLAGLIGASRASTFTGLMVARVFHAFGSGVCEALPVQLVNDIFYLHERGLRIGYYTVALCLGATGPLYAGYMLAGGYSWCLFFYVEIAFAGALFILAFFFVEETLYHRGKPSPAPSANPVDENAKELTPEHYEVASDIPPRKTFAQQLKVWNGIDKEAEFFRTMYMPFTYFFVPAVFWVISSFGIYIGLGALAFNFTFPLKITAPPYNWSQAGSSLLTSSVSHTNYSLPYKTSSGLISVGSACGYFLAVPFTFSSDWLAARLTRRNNNIREAEMRLGVMLPAMLISPAGLILYGYTAEKNLHWFGYFAGVCMCNWGSYFYFCFTLAYAVDSYFANTSEMLIAMNLGKQAISFGMGSYLLEWILKDGYVVVISGIFGGVLLANNLLLVVFLVWGKKIRRYTAGSWLARLHKRRATAGTVA